MIRDELKSRLRGATPKPEPSGDCPADEKLACYVEGGLSEAAHAEFELHLADCTWCMARVGMLARAGEREPDTELPEFTLAQAARLTGAQPPARAAWRRHAPRWAAAAIVLLAVSLVMRGMLPETPPADTAGSRTVRNIEPLSAGPRLLWPTNGAEVEIERLTFEWSPVADSLYYQVRVVTDDGDLLWQEQLTGTHWNAPPGLRLTPDSEYFVRVDAFLAEAKSVSSDFVAFRMAGDR